MYFDYAATTPPNEEVLNTYTAVNRDFWANPHALHRPGMRAETLLEQARRQVLTLLGAANDYRCIFTGGATESNNTAIKTTGGSSMLMHSNRLCAPTQC
jgi:cysteine desulfurase